MLCASCPKLAAAKAIFNSLTVVSLHCVCLERVIASLYVEIACDRTIGRFQLYKKLSSVSEMTVSSVYLYQVRAFSPLDMA